VAIDVTVPRSPGWWMQRLYRKLNAEQKRLKLLEDYYTGRPPLPWGSENQKARFYRFQQTSRSNFAALIVQAPCERCGVRSISTAVDQSENGDQTAWNLFTANDLDIHFGDVSRFAFKFGAGYMAVGMPDPDEDSGQAVITTEDPRQVTVAFDPMRTRKVIAAFKLFHDDQAQLDVAILWLPGEKWVATRERKVAQSSTARSGGILAPPELTPVSFSPTAFDLRPMTDDGAETADEEATEQPGDDYASESYDVQDVPVVPFLAREGVGRFELHTDLLDRINHMILQRIVIATMQAFRQRAIEIQNADDLPEKDDDGNVIDYDDLFSADPGALWKIPAGAKIWESGQVDLTGILSAVKDDVLHLAAVTKTPMSMFTPDAATQTAEGASMQREGLTFEVEEYLRGANRSLARVMSLAFKFMGDEERADLSRISIDWLPAERYSLAEQGSAAAQAAGSLTWEQIQRKIWQQSPAEIAQARIQRTDDLLLSQHFAAVQAAAMVRPTPPTAVPLPPDDGAPTPDDAAA
jgi:hypothetical protein